MAWVSFPGKLIGTLQELTVRGGNINKKHIKTVTRARTQTGLWLCMFIVVHENCCLKI